LDAVVQRFTLSNRNAFVSL